ncbi:hypothetical protein [Streptacidiphilus cavernicola]|uniref:Uncharacterized protein n=1 Tax=Streptacidiphilus cavernicola TaxID=3342716 RepID=A0ABV6VYC1_9ACTN
MSTALVPPNTGYPADYMQAECQVGYTDPEFVHGCPKCPAPGYRHPVLGWQARPCACPHHAEGGPS